MYLHKETCKEKFITGLFVIAQNWIPPKCPSVCEWFNKVPFVHTTITIQQEKGANIDKDNNLENL